MTSKELHAYAGIYLHQKGVKPRSRRIHVAAIRTFYKWFSSRTGITNPAEELPYPQYGKPLSTYIEPGYAEKLIMSRGIDTFIGLRDTLLIMLFCSGLRVGAVVGLNESDLIFEKGSHGEQLSIRVTKRRGNKSSDGIIPMLDEVWVMMRAYLGHPDLQSIDRLLENGDKLLFPNTVRPWRVPEEDWRGEKRRLGRQQCWVMIQTAGEKLGIPKDRLHPHAFRHLFGLSLSKADIATITRMQLLTHNTAAASEIYDHMNTALARAAMERANPFKGMVTPGKALLNSLKKEGKKEE
jgi:site-specific recombinase XerD